MSPEDNCLIARVNIAAGTEVEIDGNRVVLPGDIGLGHKAARRALAAGEKVLRYGAVIGTLTAPVAAGAHIHTHNLESDYLPTYTLTGEGHHFFEGEQS
jgi:hypothetical protein